jgi:L-ascorbate metabolism protein UlaG (beta-lactamase superfamily)
MGESNVQGVQRPSPEAIKQAKANIEIMARGGRKRLGAFRVKVLSTKDGLTPVYALKTLNVAQQAFYAIKDKVFSDDQRQKILGAMEQTVTVLSSLGLEDYCNDDGEVTDLFLTAQQFNKAAAEARNAHREATEAQPPKKARDNLATLFDNVSLINLEKTLSAEVKRQAQAGEGRLSEEPLTEIEKVKKATLKQLEVELAPATAEAVVNPDTSGLPRPEVESSGHRRYFGDVASHGLEATRIFALTQLERIASVAFGLFTDTFDYFRDGLKEKDIRMDMKPTRIGSKTPSSYWIGHATCLMNVPIQSTSKEGVWKTFNVLTDPVEGDLNPLLYPRMTKPGRKIEECPAIDVILLSHNHLDHYSAATLKKLLAMQPAMVVPNGDGDLFRKLGFTNVHELDWRDTAKLTFASLGEDNAQFEMNITAWPSYHWAGQGIFGGAGSAFVGSVIWGAGMTGGIYYAGDTTYLEPKEEGEKKVDPLKEMRGHPEFNVRWIYQPGGPDERRKDMRSTHQASADSLRTTTELLLRGEFERMLTEDTTVDKDKFLKNSKDKFKTLLMHTATFKLGNLHADDTIRSITRVIEALRDHVDEWDPLREYEEEDLEELTKFCASVTFSDGNHLDPKELADVLEEIVYVPKIGSRIDFEKNKSAQRKRVQTVKERRKEADPCYPSSLSPM